MRLVLGLGRLGFAVGECLLCGIKCWLWFEGCDVGADMVDVNDLNVPSNVCLG